MTDADSRIQVRVDDATTAWLADRGTRMLTGSHHQQAKVELAMWKAALRAELRRVRLTLAQLNCLADVLNGTLITAGIAGSVPVVFLEVSDAFQLARTGPVPDLSSYGEKHGIDEAALLAYLHTIGPTADHALHDAVSRWWAGHREATAEGWAAVGLAVAGPPAGDGRQAA
jgi:hypothetical protein